MAIDTGDGPTSVSRGTRAVIRACELIDAAERPPRLAELAAASGLSVSQLHRQFKKLLGVTPREYANARRAKRLQAALADGQPVVEAIYAAGYGSGSRVYEGSTAVLGMTPGRYRDGGRGEAIRYAIAQSELGLLLVAATHAGVCCIEFGESRVALEQEVRTRFAAARPCAKSSELADWVDQIIRFIKSPVQDVDIPIEFIGTAFQLKVWRALREIPRGSTASYRDIAAAIGQPAASRAVAAACAANPLAVAVPCHRVVRSDGSLSGYRWGVERKRELQLRERAARDDD